jgi:hypothetical protein
MAQFLDDNEKKKNIFWQQFYNFLLKRMAPNTANDRISYARNYFHVLQNNDGHTLLQLTPDKRIHTMKALSCVARYAGVVSVWNKIRQEYGLCWTTGTEKLDAFERFEF